MIQSTCLLCQLLMPFFWMFPYILEPHLTWFYLEIPNVAFFLESFSNPVTFFPPCTIIFYIPFYFLGPGSCVFSQIWSLSTFLRRTPADSCLAASYVAVRLLSSFLIPFLLIFFYLSSTEWWIFLYLLLEISKGLTWEQNSSGIPCLISYIEQWQPRNTAVENILHIPRQIWRMMLLIPKFVQCQSKSLVCPIFSWFSKRCALCYKYSSSQIIIPCCTTRKLLKGKGEKKFSLMKPLICMIGKYWILFSWDSRQDFCRLIFILF